MQENNAPSVIPENYEPKRDNFPFPSIFALSSVERDWCRNDADKIIYIKRRHMEENLKMIAGEIGMNGAELGRFIDWWCSPKPGTSEIRAEGDQYFNLRQRALKWMEKLQRPQQRPSRVEQYAEQARQIFGNPAEAFPSGNNEPAGLGYAALPDEQ